MRHTHTLFTSPMPSSSRKPPSTTTSNHHTSSALFCRNHSPSATATATLDLLILILVLISVTFLLTSYFSYIFNSLSILLPPLLLSHSSLLHHFPLLYLLGFLLSFILVAVSFEICCCTSLSFRSRKCHNPKCKGLKKALEFDLQLQTEEFLKKASSPSSVAGGSTCDVDRLPWKGGSETNPDYECLRAELRKMAPPNGRAVLLFRAKCGCPIAKLVGWGPKKGRKHKKYLALKVPRPAGF